MNKLRTKKKTVFLPIETLAREYHYKLILGVMLAEKGYRVVLGQAHYLDKIYGSFSAGVYLGKNLFKTLFPANLETFKKYKKSGWSILHLDEEGGIFAGGKREWYQELNSRLDPNVLCSDDKVLCWGDIQRDYYYSNLTTDSGLKIVTTGQPRFSYGNNLYSLLLEEKTDSDFILFNMNFGVFNDQMGLNYFLNSNGTYRDDERENYEYKRAIWLDQMKNLSNILEVIRTMLEDSDFNHFEFIVRPHPAESIEIYETYFKDDHRVKVVTTGTAIEWSKNAYCTIHDGCTTGVEAFLYGGRVVNFREQFSDCSTVNIIPNSVGDKADSYKKLKHLIFEKKQQRVVENKELCFGMIANFEQELDSFNKVESELVSSIENKTADGVSVSIYFIEFTEKVKDFFKVPLRKVLGKKYESYFKRETKKFPGFSHETLKKDLDKINSISKSQITVKRFSQKLVILEKN